MEKSLEIPGKLGIVICSLKIPFRKWVALSLIFLSPGCIKHISWTDKWISLEIIGHSIYRSKDWQVSQIVADSLQPPSGCTRLKAAQCHWNIGFTLKRISKCWRSHILIWGSSAVCFPEVNCLTKKSYSCERRMPLSLLSLLNKDFCRMLETKALNWVWANAAVSFPQGHSSPARVLAEQTIPG